MTLRRVSLGCIFSFIVLVIWNVNAAEAQQFVTDGLVAFWTLDSADINGDVVKDVSGNGNDARIMGTLNSVAGKIGQALEFDGGENYVEIPALGAWEQASIECWAYAADFASSYQGIISTWQWAAGKVHYKFESSQIQVHKNDGVKVAFDAEIGTWYHIIYTCDTVADELKLYVNGELVAEGTAGSAPQNMDERRIGSEHDGRYLTGMVDEVRIYDRILSAAEVEQNFNVTSNLTTTVDSTGKLATSWGHIK
jgi:hypothetical protein